MNNKYITVTVDKEPYIKRITDDKIINITGESGSGKSYYTNRWIDNDNYLVIDTDILFSDDDNVNEFYVALRKILNGSDKNILINDFDYCYNVILDYFVNYKKTIVIDSAQYRNMKDVSLLKGELIVMRTCIDTCFQRCIERFKKKNKNYTEDELNSFISRKKGMYEWYKSINLFLDKVDKL